MSDARSNRCVLVSHCLLAQTVRAEGCAKRPAILREVVNFCADNGLNIIQMPCPELLFSGLPRDQHGKKWFEANGFRPHCSEIAKAQAEYAAMLQTAGKEIVAVIGMEFSPACSTIEGNKSPYRQHGIFMEELKGALSGAGISPVFISINPDWRNKMAAELDKLRVGQPGMFA